MPPQLLPPELIPAGTPADSYITPAARARLQDIAAARNIASASPFSGGRVLQDKSLCSKQPERIKKSLGATGRDPIVFHGSAANISD